MGAAIALLEGEVHDGCIAQIINFGETAVCHRQFMHARP